MLPSTRCVGNTETTTDLRDGLNINVRVAWETPTSGTCNGNGLYEATLSSADTWTPELFSENGSPWVRRRTGEGPVSWQADSKQSHEFLCATQRVTGNGWCGTGVISVNFFAGAELGLSVSHGIEVVVTWWLLARMDEGRLGEVVTATTPPPGTGVVLLTGVFAVAVAVSSFVTMSTGRDRLLKVVNLVGTIVHETGHALAAVVTGGEVVQVRVNKSPDSGSTTFRTVSWLPHVVTTAAGYAMPTIAGLGAASLLHHGKTAAVLTLTVVVMALLLLFVCRDLVTICDVIAVGGLAFVTLRWAPALLQDCFAYAETWLLLTSEIAGVAVIVVNHARGRRGTDDADVLARLTLIPASVWVVGWLVLIGWGLWTATPLLWP